ncbi:plastocyanin [Halobacteriales archaeon SW_7_68_16]|nr:MAG: plastocyanin [Halobacteriales archaeon SW_7_68_16]
MDDTPTTGRRRYLAAVGLAAVGLAGCTGDTGGDGTGTPEPTETATPEATPTPTSEPTSTPEPAVEVVAQGLDFTPIRARIDPGETVQWYSSNQGAYPSAHTVTATTYHDVAETWSYDVRVDPGSRTRYTFEAAGVYEYYCRTHGRGTMCGAVIVGDATLDSALPCETDDGSAGGY